MILFLFETLWPKASSLDLLCARAKPFNKISVNFHLPECRPQHDSLRSDPSDIILSSRKCLAGELF